MTTKFLTGHYPAGYALHPKYTELVIEPHASVGGAGVSANFNATIQNFGLVNATSGVGIYLSAGTVINGSSSDTTSVIEGREGIYIRNASAAITNYGTIMGRELNIGTYDAIRIGAGGSVTNGSPTDTAALIEFYGPHYAIFCERGLGTITNFGTIACLDRGAGSIFLNRDATVTVTNGSPTDTTALIKNAGIVSVGLVTVTNFGTIGDGVAGGINLQAGGSVINGSTADTTALIDHIISYYAYSTITNFGTVSATDGTAVNFSSYNDVLQAEAGCVFNGAVLGGGGTIDLASGIGTISGLAGGDVTVSGSMAITTFTNFGTLGISSGAAFTLMGAGMIAAGETSGLTVDGALTVADTLTSTGALFIAGTIGGTGTLAIAGGSQTIDAGVALTVATWSLTGGASAINTSLAYAGAFTEGGATLTLASGDTLDLTGASSFGAGAVVNGAGTLTATNATIAGLTVGGTAVVDDVGTFDQTGTLVLRRDAGNARLTISNGATYKLDGDVGIARRESSNPMILIDGLFIKSAGTGVSSVGVMVSDLGVIEVATGTLSFIGGVRGTGLMKIDAGTTLRFAKPVANTLTASFNGAGGTLGLSNAATFAATIAGFATGETIDLVNTAATTAVLNGSDQLVITNETTAVATLQLTGTYTGATFAAASDGHGGTAITVSGGAAALPAHAHALVAAMAGLGAGAGAAHEPPSRFEAPWRPLLALPRAALT